MREVAVTVITTVYNERHQIERLLESLAAQSHPPNEVVICDGGSTDGTVATIQQWVARYPQRLPHLQLLVEPGANISRGRNVAIGAAQSPLIAVTDAGVRLSPTWLAALIAPWQTTRGDAAPSAVAGFFLADVTPDEASSAVFLTAMAATVLPRLEEIDPTKFLPSSRSVAFTKQAWAAAGGYPEWLDYCEDLLFDFAINAQRPAAPTAFAWAPNALVYFRPRGSLGAFWTQYYRYARGDGKADLWRKRHTARYVTYLIGLPVLVGLGVGVHLGFWAVLVLGGLIYVRTPYRRLRAVLAEAAHTKAVRLTPMNILGALVWVPVIRLVGDLAKMIGYPVGWWWRLQQRPPDWKQAGTS